MISVIIPLFNKESSISKTLKSVFNQTFEKFEVIVVNDGSTDRSLDIVQDFIDDRLRIIDKKNGGVSSARNRGILEAKYKYLAFLDADDLWMNNHLEVMNYMIEKYKEKNVKVFGTSFSKNKTQTIDLEKTESFIENDFLIENYFIYASKPQSLFNSSSFAVEKRFAISKGMFDEGLRYMEDVEFWHRLLKKSNLAYNKTVTAIYNIAAENRSNNNILPLQYRFHIFDYKNSNKFEKRYYDKLVSLVLLDYFLLKAYKITFLVSLMYWNRLPFILSYYKKMFFKRFFKK
mgnify:CR=1 FL=1|tara:strand:- start:656 stop:1522 length:867 start_codon:yes stop_codon:yes gene_type:complete